MKGQLLRVSLAAVLWLSLAGIALLGPRTTSGHSAMAARAETEKVALSHLSGGAIQPQAAVDSKGAVHVIYFKNGATEGRGNLYYVRLGPGETSPSQPIRVNSQED